MSWWTNWSNNSEIKRKRIVFLVCVGIASAFWLLTSLTKNYSISVAVPIKYENIPEGYVILNKPPQKIYVKLQGDGFSLMRYDSESDFDSILIDCSENELIRSSNSKYKGDYSLNVAKNSIAEQIRSELIVQKISIDTVSLVFDQVAEKYLTVKSNVTFELPNAYVLSSPVVFHPSEVKAVGAKSVLDQLDTVSIEPTDAGLIDGDVEGESKIIVPHLSLHLFPQKVEYKIEAEPITEKRIVLNIDVVNEPDSLAIRTYPSTVEITVRMGVSMYDQIKTDQFKAFVDYKEVNERSPHLIIHVTKIFDWAEVAEVSPKRAEYIIRK